MKNERTHRIIGTERKNSGSRKKFGLLLIVLLLVTPAVFAEMGTTSFMEPMTTQGESEVTDQELTRFGIALVEVQEIQMEANQQII